MIENIKKYIKEHSWVDIALIAIILIIFALLFAKHMRYPLIDKGREFFLSEQVLNGKIPLKDITLIYFPFAYYINALIYKILGVSIDSLVISQTFFCVGFCGCLYLFAKEFLSRSTSLLLTIFVITTCIFATNDIFSYIMPYSYAAAYGYMSFAVCTYFLVKLFKTDNIKFAYFASLTAGFCISCKMEFAVVLILLFAAFILYKNIRFTQFLKILFFLCIFPAIEIYILYLQGVTLQDILQALEFAKKFATTTVMHEFLGHTGMYPTDILFKLKRIIMYLPYIIDFAILSFITLLLHEKYKQKFILLLGAGFIGVHFLLPHVAYYYWNDFPIIITALLCILFVKLLKQDRAVIVLLISSVLISTKVFFGLYLEAYGTLSLPLLVLALCVVINKFFPEQIMRVEIRKVMNFTLLVLACIYFFCYCSIIYETRYEIKSPKGNIYTTENGYKILKETIKYTKSKIPENSKILVLPEGNIINFLTDRNVDLHCFMMDVLYNDAYGESRAKDVVRNADSDYIYIIETLDNNNFLTRNIYFEGMSMVEKYISENYKILEVIKVNNYNSSIKIMKKIRVEKNDKY